MSGILTLFGLRRLLELKTKGKRIPEDWEQHAINYLKRKEYAVRKFGRDWDKTQLKEARYIFELLRRGDNGKH